MSNSSLTSPPHYSPHTTPGSPQPTKKMAIATFAAAVGWSVISTALSWTLENPEIYWALARSLARPDVSIWLIKTFLDIVAYGVILTVGLLALRKQAVHLLTALAIGISLFGVFSWLFSLYIELTS